jgi:hypothetical protein
MTVLVEQLSLEEEFYQMLQAVCSMRIELKINDNRSTMLSIRESKKVRRISLHRMFLTAPMDIQQGVFDYVSGIDEALNTSVKAYIDTNLSTLDYFHKLESHKIETKGEVYDLASIFERIKHEYFQGKLDLRVSWFGRKQLKRRSRSSATFGLYSDPLKLIKVHRFLDSAYVPEYVLEFVIYHEAGHYLHPSYYNENGVNQIHNIEFKEFEKQFKDYDKAQEWIKNNEDFVFGGSNSMLSRFKRRIQYGRT